MNFRPKPLTKGFIVGNESNKASHSFTITLSNFAQKRIHQTIVLFICQMFYQRSSRTHNGGLCCPFRFAQAIVNILYMYCTQYISIYDIMKRTNALECVLDVFTCITCCLCSDFKFMQFKTWQSRSLHVVCAFLMCSDYKMCV